MHVHARVRCRDAIYFYIVSEVNEKVVSVLEGDREPDAKVIVEEKREGADCQLWYEGKLGHVRSKMNNFVMETKSECDVIRGFCPATLEGRV